MSAYILRRKDNSKNGVEQMCKISRIRPDNNATRIWKCQILEISDECYFEMWQNVRMTDQNWFLELPQATPGI